ncbi:hypothetical protein [Kocuria sp.]|uniref:hypothetical protein n=1 Tax=Kocuria sp. TaxID=1871328 RepID=UPI00281130DF|nr:hypothetical protein [Kocuria sp.]
MTSTVSLPEFLPGLLPLIRPLGMFFGALGVVVLTLRLLFVAVNALITSLEDQRKRRIEEKTFVPARRAGEEDMRMAWLQWHLRPGTTTHKKMRDIPSVSKTLAVMPRADWTIDQFRQHGREVWAVRQLVVAPSTRQKIDDRLDWLAAMISDLTDDPFNATAGRASDRYLYHQDPEVREAYLIGRSTATEKIMGTITAARDRARQDVATEGTAEFLAQQSNAAFQKLRETYRPTKARDAHAAWDAEAENIGR